MSYNGSLYTKQKVSPTADLKQYMSALQKILREPGKNDPNFAPKVDAELSEMSRRFSAVLKAPPLCLDTTPTSIK